MVLRQMLSQYLLMVYIALADVIAKITVADLIGIFMADVIAIMCEMVIPHMFVVILSM